MEEFKEFKGTKGEWEVDLKTDVVYSRVKPEGEDALICYSPDDFYSLAYENWKANAKLIAAAPNLLQALQELYYLVSELPEEGSLIEALAKAKAAIEKAL